jgi:hypothetical protein
VPVIAVTDDDRLSRHAIISMSIHASGMQRAYPLKIFGALVAA